MSFRSALDQILTILGVIVIVVPVTLMTDSWGPLIVVFVGISMIGMGVWRLGSRLMPERRVYVGLRSEVEHFIRLVRRLNAHALSGETEVVEGIRQEMRESVDRMISLAGRPEVEA
jgi:hypothetical protein